MSSADFPAESSADSVARFQVERHRLHDQMMAGASDVMKRGLALDHRTYLDGALPGRTKELLGLVASAVLRCDDCILYHLIQCRDAGWSFAEVVEALSVVQVVGGTITVPHLRRAFNALQSLYPDAPAPDDS